MNVLGFIKAHKDEDFNTFKFNEVDNLILSLIPYIDFTDIVNGFKGKKITLSEATQKLAKRKDIIEGFFVTNTFKMLKAMMNTKRYGDILLYNYMKVVNSEMQFSAITMLLNDKSIYIAYAGTDTSIIGWEEDFKMTYLYPGVSQKYAGVYFNKALGIIPHKVRIGGHSKGGNLAICAAINAKWIHQRKIRAIYNNDGPGFLREQVRSKEYKRIQNKIKMYVPVHSIIGMILYHEKDYIVVKAKNLGILQHDAFNWQCNNDGFIRAKLNKRSKVLEDKLTKKLEELPINKRIKVVNDLFMIFKNNNIKDTKDIKIREIFKLIKDFKELDKETQNILIELIITIFLK